MAVGFLQPEIHVGSDELIVSIHPGLAAAAVRLGLAEGTIPGTLGPDSEQPDSRAIVRDIVVGDLSFEAQLETWDFRTGYCLARDVRIGGEVRLQGGSVDLIATSVSGDGSDSNDDGADPSDWLRSSLTRQTISLTELLVDWSTVTVGNDQLLELIPAELETDEWQIRVVLLSR